MKKREGRRSEGEKGGGGGGKEGRRVSVREK